jgi:hypothetical protein
MIKQNVSAVWLNYAAKPVPEPIASPAYFSFDMQRGGAIPADERVMLYSSPMCSTTSPTSRLAPG